MSGPGGPGGREIDVRAGRPDRATPQRRAELRERAAELSAQLPGRAEITIARYDPLTGNPALLRLRGIEAGPAATPPAARALELARRLAPALGLDPRSELVPEDTRTSRGGATAVRLRQQLLGLPVLDSGLTVRMTGGVPTEIAARVAPTGGADPPAPTRSLTDAAAGALRHLAAGRPPAGTDPFGQPLPAPAPDPDLDRPPQLVARFTGPAGGRGVLRAGNLTLTVEPAWFPLGGSVRPAWKVAVRDPDPAGTRADVVLDAVDGTVLYRNDLGSLR